jgi:hypothetical protein
VNWRVLLLGLVAFAVVLVVVLPARWVGRLAPSAVQCAQWSGTLWRGSCRQLTVKVPGKPAVTIENAGWRLHPLPLLRGRVATEVTITDTRGDAAGHVEFARGGQLVLRGVSARVQFDPRLPIAMPEGWRGRAEIRQLELDLQRDQLRHLQGEFAFFDLRDENGRELGNYRVSFPPSTAPPFKGQIADAGGPLELQGTLELTGDRQWALDGKVAARTGSGRGIAGSLEILGAPDAAGRYPLSATGTFR